MDPVLKETWARVPWYVRLVLYAAATGAVGFGVTNTWEGAAAALATWILGNQQESLQDTARRTKAG